MNRKNLRLVNKLTISIAVYLIASFIYTLNITNKGGISDAFVVTIYPFSIPVLTLMGYSTSNAIINFVLNGISLFLAVTVSICIYKSVTFSNPQKDKKYEYIGIILLIPWFLGTLLFLLLAHIH